MKKTVSSFPLILVLRIFDLGSTEIPLVTSNVKLIHIQIYYQVEGKCFLYHFNRKRTVAKIFTAMPDAYKENEKCFQLVLPED